MNTTRITELRQAQGWTQERLANESGVGLRTVQRLEAGQDASLETLSLVADALQVPVRDLFAAIEDDALSSRVDSLQQRTDDQQASRDRITKAWRWLYVGIGIVCTLLSFTFPYGLVLFLSYWVGGYVILSALRRIVLEPQLDTRFPLSKETRTRRAKRRAAASAVAAASDSGSDQVPSASPVQ
ncbi:helix-turn-helix transcriptional regulator [Microbacterium sp. WCS2018Hpa-23]|uniref:helix-turn-helix domain-containing protein n=1 Tax=Microbacterium sp. WCS2018Hpa-23 TaxID=3073634 RepID=UPI0028830A9C|nr:helix-turn-helix transcriptional regulator [Microbacterium sp. WCS2018Hpa-23]